MKKALLFCALTLLAVAGYLGVPGTLASPALGGDCAVRSRVVHAAPVVVKKEVVVEKVVTPVIAPIAVYAPVPVYGAAFVPPAPMPAAPAQASAAGEDLKAILNALSAIDARLKAVEAKAGAPAGPAPAPKPPDPFNPGPRPGAGAALEAPKPPAFLALAQAKCASCHETKVAADKGGAFTLLDGAALAKLDDRQLRKLASVSYASRMPPKSSGVPPLTDEEVAQVMTFIDAQK